MGWLDRLLAERARAGAIVPGEDPTMEALCAGLPAEDAQTMREERAGILEHMAGLTRAEAEHRAGLG